MGATGAQGGSVVRAMKDDNKFHIRAATRNPNSDKAKELVKQGILAISTSLSSDIREVGKQQLLCKNHCYWQQAAAVVLRILVNILVYKNAC